MPIDPRHGRFLPAGRDVAQVLRAWFAQISAYVTRQIAAGHVIDLSWLAPLMTQSLGPYMFRYYRTGAQRARRRILIELAKRNLEREKAATIRTKAIGDLPSIPATLLNAFDVLLPQVRMFIDQMVYRFVQATLATATTDAMTAYREFQTALGTGIERGEALKSITVRVQQIYKEPMRAQRIAATETSRAMHAGQMASAQESGIVKELEWLASSDACERCLAIDGKRVPIGTPFWVDPKGGPYAVVDHPPLHPHCMCAAQEIIA